MSQRAVLRLPFPPSDGRNLQRWMTEVVTELERYSDINDRPGPSYTTSNVVTTRTMDADAVTTAQLADVVGTLIADLKTKGILG